MKAICYLPQQFNDIACSNDTASVEISCFSVQAWISMIDASTSNVVSFDRIKKNKLKEQSVCVNTQ